jgi:hypothetical protein
MKNIQTTVIPGINEIISDFKEAPGHLTKTAEEVGSVVKIGIGMGVLKFFSDIGISWYQAIKLTGIASDAKNAFKKLADNTSKTEDEVVNVLKNTSDNLGSSVSQFTKDTHKMGQNFGHMTETISQSSVEISSATNKASQDFGHIAKSLSQSSAEISGAVNQTSRNFGYMTHVTSDFLAYLSQNIHQSSRCFVVTCFSLTTFALAGSMTAMTAMTYLQDSSCDRDPESMLCTAPLKSMAAAAIVTGFVAIKMLMPNRVQNQVHQNSEILASNETTSVMTLPDQVLKEDMDLSFLIPEEGIDQDVRWMEEQLDSIKSTNFAVFNHIEIKRQFGGKWHKQELEWLLSRDKNIFLKVLLGRAYTTINHLEQVLLKETMALSFLIPEEGIDQNVKWTEEQLDSIKSTNFAVFNHIEIKRQFGSKWHKQELEWLLSRDKNIFLKVLLSGLKQPHMA